MWWSAGSVVLVAAGVGGWLVFGPSPAQPAAEALTAEVTSGPQRQTVSATGTVEPARRADLEFAVSGTVTGVHVAEGDRVTAGQVLATVDDELLQAEVDAADSALDAAQARRDDDAAAGASDTQLAADDAAVVSAQSRLASAEEALDNARLRSTITGTVVEVGLATGDQVSGGDTPSDGATTPNSAQPEDESDDTTGITVVSTDRYVVEAGVASSDVDKVKKGQEVEITPVDATEPIEGTVRSVGLVAEASDSGAATFPVTVDVTGERDDVYAGSSATVSIVIEEREDVLTVPTPALHSEGDTTYVNKIVDGRKVRTTVEIGTAYGAMTEVLSGLKEGDEVEIAAFVRRPGGGDGGGGEGGLDGGGPVIIGPGGSVPGKGMLPGGK